MLNALVTEINLSVHNLIAEIRDINPIIFVIFVLTMIIAYSMAGKEN